MGAAHYAVRVQMPSHTGCRKKLTRMKISDCCSAVLGVLPRPELPFLPSLLIGLCIASSVLIWLVQKETKRPLSSVVQMFFHQLFVSYPADVEDLERKKQKNLLDKVLLRWENMRAKKYTPRLKHSINTYVNGTGETSADINKRQKSSMFHLEKLSSHPWWNVYNEHDEECKLLKSKLPAIKEEFAKVFADFQKGICKQWRKVELSTGHSCVYPLITNGIINNQNCSTCPTTFQVLSECRALGLSGCSFGSASFTLLYPDTLIQSDAGDTNTRLHCDMVLQSSTSGHLEVEGKQVRWKVGDVLLYDDTFPHQYQLATSKDMTVLATPLVLLQLHLWHPGIDMSEKTAMAELFSSC